MGDVELRFFALEALGHEVEGGAVVLQLEHALFMEHGQHFFVVVAQRAQHDGDRQLAAAVDTGEDVVLGIELEVEPGAAIRDDARRVQQLAGAVRLALVVVEEHTR